MLQGTAGIAHSDSGKISPEKSKLYYSINTDLAIETAAKSKIDGVKQFIFMSSVIVYGRLPIMLLEKCAATDLSGCKACGNDRAELIDRRGKHFPILREEPHRNLLFNSVPTYAADRPPRGGQHFLFTTEKPQEMLAVLDAYERRLPPEYDIRRIKEK